MLDRTQLLTLVAALLPIDNDHVTVLKMLDQQKAHRNNEYQTKTDMDLRLTSRVLVAVELIEKVEQFQQTGKI